MRANYRLKRLLGRGGYGLIFKAGKDAAGGIDFKDSPPLYAIKTAFSELDDSFLPQKGLEGRIIQHHYSAKGLYFNTGSYGYRTIGWEKIPDVLFSEYTILKEADHELFPKVFEYCSTEKACYYVMEFVDGLNLRAHLENGKENNSKKLVRQLYEVLISLSQIYRQSQLFYHGDIKPENILMDRAGKMKIVDPAYKPKETVGWHVTLTPQYNPFGLSGAQADTFAIAVIILETLLGRVPFVHLNAPVIKMWGGSVPSDEKEKSLKFNELKKELPKGFSDIIFDWLLEPRSYDEMLREWDKLDAVI